MLDVKLYRYLSLGVSKKTVLFTKCTCPAVILKLVVYEPIASNIDICYLTEIYVKTHIFCW